MTILTIDLDTADEIDVLYAIDKLSELLPDPEAIYTALSVCAFDIAEIRDNVRSDTSTFDMADRIYPQPNGSNTWHRSAAHRDAHLRRFGMLSEGRAAA